MCAVVSPHPASAKYASIVIDADSGRILHSVNADTRNYPASLTKMMTLYLMFEALEEGRWKLSSPIKISPRAARQPASRLGLRPGRSITVRDAILALVTKSANDIAAAVAEALGGSERNFALMMTATARKLGMTRTTFRNASGLPHRGQLSTARDMARLGRALLGEKGAYYHYFSREHFRYAGVTHQNHNNLLSRYDGTDGIKTGYIRASGFNLVASAERGGYRLIGVVFGGKSPKQRDGHMVDLLDKGFRRVDTTLAAAANVKDKPQTAHDKRRQVAIAAGAISRRLAITPGLDWAVQVGAFRTYAPAHGIARKAKKKATGLLDGGVIAVVPLKQRNRKTVYRARIVGVSKKSAYQACRLLKRKRISCMELRLQNTRRVASRSG